ncbi:MAG: DUF349 domain-containing protein [Propionibacteriaceae bacterium]|jgi:chromosome segregation ATPase|nr:DUF349 domain-containing protein [Propionibacteriaceae bacterium]
MTTLSSQFGRVAEDGTVFVKTNEGERSVGQIPDVSPEEALAFYTKRYEQLEGQIGLLASRIRNGALSPEQGRQRVRALTEQVKTANAVGDLDALNKQLEDLLPEIEERTAQRKEEKARLNQATKEAKEEMVKRAEALSQGNDWRGGADKFRALLEEWKALPRIDKATDEELWHRFSTARTAFTRRRKAQFAQLNAQREEAKALKEQIIAEAEVLAPQRGEWGRVAGEFRDLMNRWRQAGSAGRKDDEALWERFHSLQDEFFTARQDAAHAQDSEYSGNLSKKLELLDAAEKDILPVTDIETAKAKFRTFLDQFNQYGRIPRDQMRSVDSRVKALEKAVHEAEEAEWRRTDPQAKARAQETVSMLENEIEKLRVKIGKAEARGDQQAVRKAEDSIRTYETWLESAKATLADFK